jgi:hypothetical protein
VAESKRQDPEELWLDAVEAEERGEREQALELATATVQIDPENADAWWAIARLTLPFREPPDLKQAAKSMAACRRVVELEPDRREAWLRGGQILVEELGMLDQALEWWQARREVVADEVEPLIEQIAILSNLGLYQDAADRLAQLWAEGMQSQLPSQLTRTTKLHGMVELAVKNEAGNIFRPWEPKHEMWKEIEQLRHRKPAKESWNFIWFVGPIVWLEALMLPRYLGDSIWGLILLFILVLGTVLIGSRLIRKLTRRINRPALNLLRAMDVEMTSGKTCIPSEWVKSKLYLALMREHTPAFRTRLESIAESGEELPSYWRPNIPDLSTVDLVETEDVDDDDITGPLVLPGYGEEE